MLALILILVFIFFQKKKAFQVDGSGFCVP